MTALKTSAIRVATGVGLLLLIPSVAKLALQEMNWGIEDFAAAGALLFGAGMACSLVVERATTRAQKRLGFAAVLLTLAIVWAELAVGIFH